MIELIRLTKNYNNIRVLDSIHGNFHSGEVHGLLGANGAGKSTLIKIIMGLVFSDSGQVNKPKSISFLPENPYLPLNLSAFQIVSHACRMQEEVTSVECLLKEVLLKKEAWFKPIRTYSKGMKQRTSIACALASKPQWIILDEPMSGLDAMGRKQMLDLFARYKGEGVSFLMCSHSVTDLVRLCNQVHIMAEGKICQSVNIEAHSMDEAENLEMCLMDLSGHHAVD